MQLHLREERLPVLEEDLDLRNQFSVRAGVTGRVCIAAWASNVNFVLNSFKNSHFVRRYGGEILGKS